MVSMLVRCYQVMPRMTPFGCGSVAKVTSCEAGKRSYFYNRIADLACFSTWWCEFLGPTLDPLPVIRWRGGC